MTSSSTPEPAPEEMVFNEQLTEAFGEEQIDEFKRQLENNKDVEGAKEYRKIWNHFAPDMTIQKLPKNKGGSISTRCQKR